MGDSLPGVRMQAKIKQQPAAEGTGETSADVYIYDDIVSAGSMWVEGTSSKQIIDEISGLDVDVIVVHINSLGGDAWEGIAIMNALRHHEARIEVIVDAIAASAASAIAMAGDTVTMNRGAQMMIHDPWTWSIGNAEDLRKTADALDVIALSYADLYAAKAGGDREAWRARMVAESWYTAEEAVEAGLADEWVDAEPVETSAATVRALAQCKYQGRANAPAPDTTRLPASEPGENNTAEEENTMSDSALRSGVRERLGLADTADDAAILAALDERTNRAAAPEGTVLIDETVLADLKRDAAAGADAMRHMIEARRDGIVAKALAEGRITPATKASWRQMLDSDEEGTSALLAQMAANSVPVTEIGLAGEADASADDVLYSSMWGEEGGAR